MDIFHEITNELLNALLKNTRLSYQENLADYSHGEMTILVYLRDQRSGLCAGELAEELGMTLPRMSVAIAGLAKKGFVTKDPDVSDKRKIRINITPDGIRYVNEKECRLKEQVCDILMGMGPDDTEEYLRILKKIQDIFQN